jgi:hypothetical protein
MVDSAGHFVLGNVPAGDVRLRFSGPGVNAELMIAGVREGDEINITVAVSASSATLENTMRQDSERKVEVEGVVARLNCPSFLVNNIVVATNTATQFTAGSCASLKIGAKVEATGTRQADGSVLASRVELEENETENEIEREANEAEFEGTVTAGTCASFTVNGIVVTTNAGTVFRKGACGDIKQGAKVEVKGTRTSAGVVATRIDVDVPESREDREAELEGIISAATGCTSFTVNGVLVTTTSATQFRNGACADIKPKVKVEVKGTRTSATSIAASRVEIKKD